MRISGINIEENKHLDRAITAVYGIGLSRARNILDNLNVEYSTKPKALTKEQEVELRKKIEGYKIEGDLRREISRNIKRLKDVSSLRGDRHKRGLPVRGQRTKTNARTRKGPKKTMGSGKVKLQKK